jgi:hypothetical protein
MAEGNRKARFIHPPNILREKVGYGGIEPERLEKAEVFLVENPIDFRPYAREFLGQIDAVIAELEANIIDRERALSAIRRPVMELKAHGAMFNYRLISDIADIVLNFIENIHEMNDDAFDILDVHHKSLDVIVSNELVGNGGMVGKSLADELFFACERYYKKHGVSPQNVISI